MESVSHAPDVILVSAYGRGHWLALELKRKNWNVSLIDVSAALGAAEPEDWDGPWGFFDVPSLQASQRARLLEHDRAFPVAAGFTVWLPNGPMEMSGRLASFQAQAFGIKDIVRKYLEPVVGPARSAVEEAPRVSTSEEAKGDAKAEAASAGERSAEKIPSAASIWLASLSSGVRKPDPLKGLERLHRQVRGLPFEESWLAQLAHACASNVFTENKDAIEHGGPLPLAAAYGVRHCTAESIEESFKKLESAGVRVIRNASISDVRLVGKSMDAIEVKAERHGVEQSRAFVWMLSSLETKRFPESVVKCLFPGGACEAKWAWTRFRFRFNENSATQALPLAFAMLENVYLPWTHANLALVKRVRGKGKENEKENENENENEKEPSVGGSVRVDVWLRVPAHAIGDESYFSKLRDEVAAQFARRLPLSEPVCESLPAESRPDSDSARSPRFAVYDPSALHRLSLRGAKNLFFDGPEQWSGFDWLSQFRYQQALLFALDNLKKQWEAMERRTEVRT